MTGSGQEGIRERPWRLTLGSVVAFPLGFLLIFAAPYGDGYFRDWLIPFIGSYRLTLFDALAMPACLAGLLLYEFRIKRSERLLFGAVVAVIATRLVSLLASQASTGEQIVSILRYVETLVVVYVGAQLFISEANRRRFVHGIILAVAIETASGLALFVMAGAQLRGIVIGVNAFMLQVFLIVAGLASAGPARRWRQVGVAVLVLGVLATLTRGALVLLAIALAATAVFVRTRVLRPFALASATVVLALAALSVTPLATAAGAVFVARVNAFRVSDGSVTYRLYLWDLAAGTFVRHPLTGIGSGGFARQQRQVEPLVGVQLSEEYRRRDLDLGTHSTLMGVAAETGLFGLAAYGLWVFAVFKMCVATLHLARAANERFATAAAITVIALILTDATAQGSFMPVTDTLLAFAIGWRRSQWPAPAENVVPA